MTLMAASTTTTTTITKIRTPIAGNLRTDLVKLLAEVFVGIEITIGHSKRWNRPFIEFRCEGFSGLLPEERFRRLMGVIPATFYEDRMRGQVCLELAPGEDLEEFLALPRSDDVVDEEPTIARRLLNTGFFDQLEDRLEPSPMDACQGGLILSRSLLQEAGWSAMSVERACLVLIRQRSFCDCEVLLRARGELKSRFGKVASGRSRRQPSKP